MKSWRRRWSNDHLMKIYTKTGDSGETSLFDGTRVSKTDPRVAAYGDVDELNAWLLDRYPEDGLTVACGAPGATSDLYSLGYVALELLTHDYPNNSLTL